MEFIRGRGNLQRQKRACIATIGNFDGVHLGHQAVLRQLKSRARAGDAICSVLIFEPQPIEFFSPDKAPSRLTCLREKIEQFERHQIDRVVCLTFDAALAALSADEFVREILVNELAVRGLIIGDDFRFGRDREGDYAFLVAAGQRHGFTVQNTASLNMDGARISSTLIRKTLAGGDMARARRMLGRPYRISGRVAHGKKRGRRLGFATANIELRRYLSPLSGTFSARVYGVSERPLPAAVYVGRRPVYHGRRVILEAHILDFERDLYGRRMQVEFLEKLRGEQDFDSEHELIEQIRRDVMAVRRNFKAALNKSLPDLSERAR